MITEARFKKIIKILKVKEFYIDFGPNISMSYDIKNKNFIIEYYDLSTGNRIKEIKSWDESIKKDRIRENILSKIRDLFKSKITDYLQSSYKEEFKQHGDDWILNGLTTGKWLTDDELVIKDILE